MFIRQVIEDPVEIIDNERELKGFYNMDEVIKLVGYFKSEKSPRRLKPWRHLCVLNLSCHDENCCSYCTYCDCTFSRLHWIWRCCWGVPSVCQVLCHIWPQGYSFNLIKSCLLVNIKKKASTGCLNVYFSRSARSWNWRSMKLTSTNHSWRSPSLFQESLTSSPSWLSTLNSTTGE